MHIVRQGFPDRPGLDTAISRTLMLRASRGIEKETIRLHRPERIVAFGRRDVLAPGYRRAVAEARQKGFAAVERLAGGRAAVFHPGTIALSWTIPDPQPPNRIRERFSEVTAVITSALRGLGVDARVGEVPGEYCPGEFSINARGVKKLVGVGQRLARRAAHIGCVVVVHGGELIRDVLVPVYRALELEWDPSSVGAIDEEADGATLDGVGNAIVEELGSRYSLVDTTLSAEAVAEAESLQADHLVGSVGGRPVGR